MTKPILMKNVARSSSVSQIEADTCWCALPNVAKPFESSVPGVRRNGSVKTMRNKRKPSDSVEPEKDMLPEYRFDYSRARPNRFAARMKEGSRAVVLDPDVAAVFSTPETVNAVLRALIESMPVRT
jgi:hypothetical protein